MTSSGTCHQDVADILRNKTTNKDTNLKEPDIHNNMVLNKEFAFVVNVVMGQNTGSILHTALRSEGVNNVQQIFKLSDSDMNRIKFRSPQHTRKLVSESLGQALKELLKNFKIFFQTKVFEKDTGFIKKGKTRTYRKNFADSLYLHHWDKEILHSARACTIPG